MDYCRKPSHRWITHLFSPCKIGAECQRSRGTVLAICLIGWYLLYLLDDVSQAGFCHQKQAPRFEALKTTKSACESHTLQQGKWTRGVYFALLLRIERCKHLACLRFLHCFDINMSAQTLPLLRIFNNCISLLHQSAGKDTNSTTATLPEIYSCNNTGYQRGLCSTYNLC